jgi:dethiobiotin synthetase
VAGTDTGAGKTAVTGLLLAHLQAAGKNVHPAKPFCSGERTDAVLLWEIQNRREPLEKINPWYFDAPLSPWTAARKCGVTVTRAEALDYLQSRRAGCDLLLVEGSGGLLSPLGERFHLGDLIVDLGADVILVAPDRLGVLNATLLALEALHHRQVRSIRIALVEHSGADLSCKTNFEDLKELAAPHPVVRIPFLSNYHPEAAFISSAARQLAKELEKLVST